MIARLFRFDKISPYWIVAAAAFLAYGWSIGFGFVFYDDKDLILDNAAILSNWANIGQAFFRSIWPSHVSLSHYYRPIELVTWIIDYHIGDTQPWIYHFSNVAYHAIASALFYVLLGSLGTQVLWRLPLALMYAVHPGMAATVAWIPGRNDSLLAVFSFLTLIFALKTLNSGRSRDLIGYSLTLLLALFTKESAIVLPVLTYFLVTMHPQKNHATSILGVSVAAWIFYFIMRQSAAPGGNDSTFAPGPIALLGSLIASAPALFCFIGKVFLPIHTQVMPTFSWLDFSIGLGCLIAIGRLITMNPERNAGKILFAIALFVLFLAPSLYHSPDVKLSQFLLLEHRLAVPMAGALLVMPQLVSSERLLENETIFKRIAGIVITLFVVIAVVCQSSYRDRTTFWHAAVRSNSLAFSRVHLGDMYLYDNDPDTAKKWYDEALAINPKEYMVNNNIGVHALSRNDLDSAEAYFKKELEAFPTNSRSLINLAIVSNRRNKHEEAEQRYLQLLALYPDFIEAYRQLTVLYIQMKKPEEAEKVIAILRTKGDSIPDYILDEIRALKKSKP